MSGTALSMDPLWWSKTPCSTPRIDRVDEVHDALVEDLERLKTARTPRERGCVVPRWADQKRQLAFDLARAAIAVREQAEAELPGLRARLHDLTETGLHQRLVAVTDQLDAELKWVPVERIRRLDPPGRGSAFLEHLERPFIAYLAVTRPTKAVAGRGAFEQVETYVRLSVEAVELEREQRGRWLEGPPDNLQMKPEFIPATAAFVIARGCQSDEPDNRAIANEAMKILDKQLPLRKLPAAVRSKSGGRNWRDDMSNPSDGADRLRDGTQDLREQIIELLAKLGTGETLADLSGRLLAHDPELRYVSHHAWRDFCDQLRHPQDALHHFWDEPRDQDHEDVDAFGRRGENDQFSNERTLRDEYAETLAEGRDALEARIWQDLKLARLASRSPRIAERERRILATILRSPHDIDATIAHAVGDGCRREDVNRFRARLRKALQYQQRRRG